MVYGTYNYSIHGVYKPTNIMFGGLTLYMCMDFHGFSTFFFMEKMDGTGTVDQSSRTQWVPHGPPRRWRANATRLPVSSTCPFCKAQLESPRKSVGKVWEIPWQTSNPWTVRETSMIFTKTEDVSDIVHVSYHFLRQQGTRNFAPGHQPLRSAWFDPWSWSLELPRSQWNSH